MIDFHRGPQDSPDTPAPFTWDYCKRFKKDGGANWALQSEHDLANCMCAEGHSSRLSGTIHHVAEDGSISPSYVCPVKGCMFHDWVRLVGFDVAHSYEVVLL